MHKPDKETFKYVIYDSDTGGVIFKENTPAYFDTVDDIIPILSELNNKDIYDRYITRLANLADIKKSMKNGPGIYFIQTLYAGLINTDINVESKMSKEECRYIIANKENRSLVIKEGVPFSCESEEKVRLEVKKLNERENTNKYTFSIIGLDALRSYASKGPGEYPLDSLLSYMEGQPLESPLNKSFWGVDIFRNQEALSQQQAMERQHAMNNPFNPGPYFRPEFADSPNNPLFSPSHFQPPQKPQMINKFGMPNIIPIIPNKEIGFNNHPDWKLIKKIGTDESGTKVVVEVEIDDNRMIKIVDTNDITSKNVGSFFVVVFSTQNGDLMSLNPSTAALKNMVFKTAYRLNYYDDGIFVISNPFTDVDALITEMNKDMSDLHDFHNQLNTQPFTLIR